MGFRLQAGPLGRGVAVSVQSDGLADTDEGLRVLQGGPHLPAQVGKATPVQGARLAQEGPRQGVQPGDDGLVKALGPRPAPPPG